MSFSSGNAALAQPNAYYQASPDEHYRSPSAVSQQYPNYSTLQARPNQYRGNTIDSSNQQYFPSQRLRTNTMDAAGQSNKMSEAEKGNQCEIVYEEDDLTLQDLGGGAI
jgi:hypothetical protein